MITRFSQVACPTCGTLDKPTATEPGSGSVEGVLNLIPVVGAAYGGYRMTGTKLYCRHCGHQFTDSVQDKARTLFGRAREIAAKVATDIQAPVCGTCHQRLPSPTPPTCPHCETVLAPQLPPGD